MGDVMSAKELVKVGRALADGMGRPITEEEFEDVVAWARDLRMSEAMLSLILEEKVLLSLPDPDDAANNYKLRNRA